MEQAIRLSFLFFLQLHLFSCGAQIPDKGDKGASTTLEVDTIGFPVFQKFSDFEPLLQPSDDTTYVVNFWATWCKPCIAELPYFEQLHKANLDKPIKVVLVSMDFPKQIKTKLIPFLKEHELQAQVVALIDMDYNSWIDKVSLEWDGAIPFTLIYNQKRRLTKSGDMENFEELNNLLRSAMID